MKQKILISIAFLFALNVYGQKCKYSKNEIDPISKKTIKITERKILTGRVKISNNILAIKGARDGEDILLLCGLTMMSSTSRELIVKKGFKAYLLLDNNSTVEIECIADFKAVLFAQKNLGKFQYGINPQYNIPMDVLQKILDKKVKMVRIEVENNGTKTNEDTEIRDDDMIEISNVLKCVM